MFTNNTNGTCEFVQMKIVKGKVFQNTSEICTNYKQNSWQACNTNVNKKAQI